MLLFVQEAPSFSLVRGTECEGREEPLKRRVESLKNEAGDPETWFSRTGLSPAAQPWALPAKGLGGRHAAAAKSRPEVSKSFVNPKDNLSKNWAFLTRGHSSDPWVYYLKQQ